MFDTPEEDPLFAPVIKEWIIEESPMVPTLDAKTRMIAILCEYFDVRPSAARALLEGLESFNNASQEQ